MSNTHTRVAGDGAGDLQFTLAHNGAAQNLSGATVTYQLRERTTGVVLTGNANIITAASGLVAIDEDALKTIPAGTYDVRFIVAYASGGTPDIFPSTMDPAVAVPPTLTILPAWT